MAEIQTPIAIIGGGCGGVAAALAIARNGGSCVLTEPTDWVGGQLTSQAVPPDENRWIEGGDSHNRAPPDFFGATRSYLSFRQAVRQWYRDNRRLTPQARQNPRLNPGGGWVSHLCCEPSVAHAVLLAALEPHRAAGRVRILYQHEPVAADVAGDRVRSVMLRDSASGDPTTILAEYFLDATELGDLYPLAGVEYLVGAEHRDDFGELHGRGDRADPLDQQAISWCFAVEHRPGEDHTISRPENYQWWRDYVPRLDHPWPGRLFSWTIVAGEQHEPREYPFIPWPDQPREDQLEMWRYRRIVDHSIYEPPDAPPDVSLINMVQMDYFQKPLLEVSAEARAAALQEARQQSLCFLYWMQTEAPRWNGGTGYPGLKLRGDVLGTTDGFAKHPYIREPRRLRARTIVHEGHIGTEQRRKERRPDQHLRPFGVAEPFADSVGIGHYRLDLHPSTAMRGSLYVPCAPFRIPMGALIPQRVRNVLAAGKAIGVSHIANGAYRMHPTEWNNGEAAGLLAWHCLSTGTEPHAVHDRKESVRLFQDRLTAEGVPLAWPWETTT
ncbi:MAG: FAD-dependent oxidoreductase [Phycisphaerae bacterium]|nr:FAD-dependent oxidoreductase [Phycisphaerae bacterium]MDW8261945.1 FAD-dependent oxidoreductase [Phycisphaerales bacterium]